MISSGARHTCLIVGAGVGLGSALARAFTALELEVCLTRRSRHFGEAQALAASIRESGGKAHAFGVDARLETETVALFEHIERDIGPLDVVVFNIGANVRFPIAQTTSRVFTKVWEMACFAGFLAGREAAKAMLPRGCGTILFTGATASLRGGAGFAAFAAAKHGLRALAQSMARELGPKGIHVAHVVIDGAMDGAFVRANRSNVEEMLVAEEILKPEAVADNFVLLHQQPRSAWTHELDLRPWKEPW